MPFGLYVIKLELIKFARLLSYVIHRLSNQIVSEWQRNDRKNSAISTFEN